MRNKKSIDLLLIMPSAGRGHGAMKHEIGKLSSAPLTLPYLASLVPPDVNVSIVDENVDDIDYEKQVDLVGISTLTMTAPRAYRISERFKERGTPVVLGGTHPTALPEEASRHADAVVVGEAEGIMEKLIMDFRGGKMKKIYRRRDLCSLDDLPHPRWDLVNKKAYLTTNVVQATRGCPHNCCFCALPRLYSRKYRCRPVEDIIREIDTLDGKLLGFVDVDIMGNPEYAKKLFRALIPYKKMWGCDVGIKAADDDELLRLAAKSGCKSLYIGFESLSPESLKEAGKPQNIGKYYKEVIDKLNQHGISVMGGFVFGFDTDDESVFERAVEFAIESKIVYLDFNVINPLPDTPVYYKLLKEGRIIETDWSKYWGFYNVVYRPKRMSVETLREGCLWAWKEFYSAKSIFKRFLSRPNYTSLVNPIGYLILNIATHRGISRFG